MTYHTFSDLWRDALEISDFDRYIAERGWQSWMDAYADQSDSAVFAALTRVWDMAHGGTKAMRAMLGSSQAAFAAALGIPKRSIECWESANPANVRTPPDYLPVLLGYAVLSILEERDGNA